MQPGDDFWYLDEANVLSDATEGEIFFANQRLYDVCGAEIVVVAIESTGKIAIDDYAYTLFNEWEIGGSSYRGLLLLLAIKDDNYYVMPGTSASVYFDSATIGTMMDKYLEPDFARKDYDRGARLFFEAAYEKMVDDLNLNLSISDAKADYESFLKNASSARQENSMNPEIIDRAEQSAGSGNASLVILLMILALIVILRSPGRVRHTSPRRSSAMMTGFLLGRMSVNRRRYPGTHAGPHIGFRPPMGNPGGVHRNRPTGSFSGRSSSGGFGGASRGSFGGSSRPSGGFGGASRSGGASRGPSTRGGGAGRFSRR